MLFHVSKAATSRYSSANLGPVAAQMILYTVRHRWLYLVLVANAILTRGVLVVVCSGISEDTTCRFAEFGGRNGKRTSNSHSSPAVSPTSTRNSLVERGNG
mmetsp:Transcript_181/g.299  ORF Transcript_181/g.299 Transcript_181/m.299 type:complete len:101 (-) Transcript_181:21-323(-)